MQVPTGVMFDFSQAEVTVSNLGGYPGRVPKSTFQELNVSPIDFECDYDPSGTDPNKPANCGDGAAIVPCGCGCGCFSKEFPNSAEQEIRFVGGARCDPLARRDAFERPRPASLPAGILTGQAPTETARNLTVSCGR